MSTRYDPAIRTTLRLLLHDLTAPEAVHSDRINALLSTGVTWTDEERSEVRALALSWAQRRAPSLALAIRKAMGESLSEEEVGQLDQAKRQGAVMQALLKAYEQPRG